MSSNSLAYATLKTLSLNKGQHDFFQQDGSYAPESFNKIFGHVIPEKDIRAAIEQLQKEKEEREKEMENRNKENNNS